MIHVRRFHSNWNWSDFKTANSSLSNELTGLHNRRSQCRRTRTQTLHRYVHLAWLLLATAISLLLANSQNPNNLIICETSCQVTALTNHIRPRFNHFKLLLQLPEARSQRFLDREVKLVTQVRTGETSGEQRAADICLHVDAGHPERRAQSQLHVLHNWVYSFLRSDPAPSSAKKKGIKKNSLTWNHSERKRRREATQRCNFQPFHYMSERLLSQTRRRLSDSFYLRLYI